METNSLHDNGKIRLVRVQQVSLYISIYKLCAPTTAKKKHGLTPMREDALVILYIHHKKDNRLHHSARLYT